MPYNNVISRTDAQATIPEEVGAELTRGAVQASAGMTLFRRVNISTNQQRMPVLSALPTAYFVNGDTGLKQTTEVAWDNKYLNVEEVAAIVPIPEAVLDDSSFDVWGEVRPLLEEAIGRTVDAAVFFGVNKPASWPDDIETTATTATQTVTRGTATAAQGGVAEDINSAFSLVEVDGFDNNGIIARTNYKGLLRGARDANGQKHPEVNPTEAYGVGITYPMRGLWTVGSGETELITGDFTQGIFGLRQDYTYKVLDQAVIQDGTGTIIFNLAQQDMVALRIVARYAWQVANVITRDEETEADRWPFALVLAP